LYFNRALALSKLKKYQDAISDCTEALDRDPSYVKVRPRLVFLWSLAVFALLGVGFLRVGVVDLALEINGA
jgi:tetratricopeptide (TPR) repeat protein